MRCGLKLCKLRRLIQDREDWWRHVTPPFTSSAIMLSAVTRATAGILRGVKPSLTPQNLQNEGTKIVSALSVNSEYGIFLR